MSFLQPTFLGFLALSAIPVVLYLLFRRRKHEVDWGASYILRLTLGGKQRQSLWKQIVIVALRTLLLGVLVAAFARPFLPLAKGRNAQGFPHGPNSLHRIIVVDNSRSMLAYAGSVTRLDQARQIAADLMAATRAGDVCHLITLCPDPKTKDVGVHEAACPVRRAAAWSLVGEITPSSESIDLPKALRAAVETFLHSPAAERQIIFLSGFCRRDYVSMSDVEAFGSRLRQMNVRVGALRFGSAADGNLAVESLTTGSELVLAGQPSNVYVDLMNYSDGKSGDAHVQLLVDGVEQAREPCALPAGHRKRFAFPITLTDGPHRLEARVSDDLFSADNTLERFVRAVNRLRILVVTPQAKSGEGFEREGEFLRRVLGAAEKSPFQLEVQVLDDNLLTPAAFNDRDVVMVCGVSGLAPPSFAALEVWVHRGGGLIVSLSPALNAETFNKTFSGLLAAKIGAPFRERFDAESYASIQTSDIPLPLLREFERSDNGDLSLVRVYNHFTLPEPASPAPLLSLNNGDPLLVEAIHGRGRALLWLTTLGGEWSSLPVQQAYLPLLYRLINHAAGFREPPRNVSPGDPLIYPLAEDETDPAMTTPYSRLLKCATVMAAGKRFVRFEQTDTPGVYELQAASGKPLASFSVGRDGAESDFRGLDARQAALFEKSMDTTISPDVPSLRDALWNQGSGLEWSGWFLLIAVGLLALDATLTRIWFS